MPGIARPWGRFLVGHRGARGAPWAKRRPLRGAGQQAAAQFGLSAQCLASSAFVFRLRTVLRHAGPSGCARIYVYTATYCRAFGARRRRSPGISEQSGLSCKSKSQRSPSLDLLGPSRAQPPSDFAAPASIAYRRIGNGNDPPYRAPLRREPRCARSAWLVGHEAHPIQEDQALPNT